MHIILLNKLRFDQMSCSGRSGTHWRQGVSKWYEMVKRLGTPLGYRLSLSASVHSQTWPVIVTVMKRAMLSSSLPVPRSTADENSNHNHLIVEENSFTVQLTCTDGNCSSSIYLPEFYLCFVSKTL